jgi:ABC-type lipoprotein export system ATPase subunit
MKFNWPQRITDKLNEPIIEIENLSIEKNSLNFIIGEIGSGKSAFL